MELTEKGMRNLARLASIELHSDELEYFSQEVSAIMHWIDQLQEVDVSGVGDELHASMPEREDIVTEPDQSEAVLANAPDAEMGWFGVPKMIVS